METNPTQKNGTGWPGPLARGTNTAAVHAVDQPLPEASTTDAPKGSEFELVVQVQGTDLKDIVAWLRQAIERIEQGEREMNMEEETAAGSFFVDVFEQQENDVEKTGDETPNTSASEKRSSDHEERDEQEHK